MCSHNFKHCLVLTGFKVDVGYFHWSFSARRNFLRLASRNWRRKHIASKCLEIHGVKCIRRELNTVSTVSPFTALRSRCHDTFQRLETDSTMRKWVLILLQWHPLCWRFFVLRLNKCNRDYSSSNQCKCLCLIRSYAFTWLTLMFPFPFLTFTECCISVSVIPAQLASSLSHSMPE